MANYQIKMLKDENGTPFVPLVSTQGIQDPEGKTLDEKLSTKLGPDNLIGGENINIRTEGNNCYIDMDLPSSLNIINNLTTDSAGQGALDAYQGKVLNELISQTKEAIPAVIDDLTNTSSTSSLSANQGYVLNGKINSCVKISDLEDLVNSIILKKHPIGSIEINTNGTNPSEYIGGTWELIDKGFRSYASNSSSVFEPDTTNCTLESCYYTRSNHSMQIRLNFTNKVPLNDTNLDLGTFNFSELGIEQLPYGLYYVLGATDEGNAFFGTYINYSTGLLRYAESAGTISSNSSCYLLFEFMLTYDRMADEFCDKFYWKRVS